MTTDRDLHQQADRQKADLSTANGVAVPTGQEATPPARQDPNELRKAMFAKSDRMRAQGIPRSGDDVVDTSGGDDPVATAEAARSGRDTLHLPARDTGTTPASQTENAYVTLQAEGGQIQVAKADIDRAGGTELYLRRRALDAEAIELQQQRVALDRQTRELAESNRLREEQRGNRRVDQDDPANRGADPAPQDRNGSGNAGVDMAALAKRLAAQIYSGDQGDAEKAITEIVEMASRRGETLNADEIANRAAEKVRTASNATGPTQPTPVRNPVVEAVNAAINTMARADYADVCNDEPARAATFAKFQQMCKLPENKDRRAVDIARDACEWGRQTLLHPRSRVIEQKRGLPTSVAASGATSAATDEPEVMDASSYIDALNNRRNFGRRAKP